MIQYAYFASNMGSVLIDCHYQVHPCTTYVISFKYDIAY